jgi:hypothetical protein
MPSNVVSCLLLSSDGIFLMQSAKRLVSRFKCSHLISQFDQEALKNHTEARLRALRNNSEIM